MNDKTINEYIDELKNGRDTAERWFNLRKAIWNRANAAYDKAKASETALKEYCDRIAAADLATAAIDKTLLRAANTGQKVDFNTKQARRATELLTYEIMDITCQAENLADQLKLFKDDIEKKIGKDKPALACIDEVLKTIPDVSKSAFEGLDKALDIVKTISIVNQSIADDCGINARILKLTKSLKTCGFKEELSDEEKSLANKYPCVVPDAATIGDNMCDDQYTSYANSDDPVCKRNFDASFAGYRSVTKTNYDKAVAKSKAALDWLNCAAEAKNTAEAAYNACKAAHSAAVEAKKC